MAKKIALEELGETDELDILPPAASEPEVPEDKTQQILQEIAAKEAEKARIQREADEAARKAFGKPVEIVELDDVIQAESLTPVQQRDGIRFWFGEIGVLTFPDKSTYHITQHSVFITDTDLIAKLKEYAERVPTAKIFIQ
jgi:hypothetical protein